MFDRSRDIVDSLIGGGSRTDIDERLLEAALADEERLVDALDCKRVERTLRDEQTSIDPGDADATHMLLTDERLLFVGDSDPEAIELAVEYGEVTDHRLEKTIASDRFVFETDAETIAVTTTASNVDDVAAVLDTVGECWRDVAQTVESVRSSFDAIEQQIVDDGDEQRFQNARSNLASARQHVVRTEDAPQAKLDARLDTTATRLRRLRVDAWIERLSNLRRTLVARAQTAAEGPSCDVYQAAIEAFDALGRAFDDVEDHVDVERPDEDNPDDDAEADGETTLSDLADRIEPLGIEIVEYARREFEDALKATALAEETFADGDDFEAYLRSVTIEESSAGADALRVELRWIPAHLLEVLAAHATDRNEPCTVCGYDDDDVYALYETAHGHLTTISTITGTYRSEPPAALRTATDRLAAKRDRAEWQWGGP